jgi:dolichyl-phosphate-mannose-protein mannosyltransferase
MDDSEDFVYRLLFRQPLISAVLLVFVLHMILSLLPPLEGDMVGWRFWSGRMLEVGPAHFYSPDVFTANPPGYLYVFWLCGFLKQAFLQNVPYGAWQFDFLLKFPSNITDILTGLLIYEILRVHLSKRLSIFGFLLYTLNPAVLFNSSIFGQFDSPATLFGILAFYLYLYKKQPELAAASFAISWAIKPQAIVFAPAIGLLFLLSAPFKRLITSGITFILTTLLIYLPFFPTDPINGIVYVNTQMTQIFTCTTCFAFNFWGIFGNWNNDTITQFGLPLTQWGIILTLLTFIPIFFIKPIKIRFQEPLIYFATAISALAFFTFVTRMHERYVFPFFAPFLLAVFLLRSKYLLWFYIFYSLFNTVNVYLPYAYYNTPLHLTPELVDLLMQYFKVLSLIGTLSLAVLFGLYFYQIKLVTKKIHAK